MVYEFTVVSATASNNAEQAYFQQVERCAQDALAANEVTAEDAFAACEYLDCVDGGDIAMNKSLYRQCTALVMGFLFKATPAAAQELAGRSWAAKTLASFLAAQNEQFDGFALQQTQLLVA